MDGWMHGRTDGLTDGRTDARTVSEVFSTLLETYAYPIIQFVSIVVELTPRVVINNEIKKQKKIERKKKINKVI